MFGDDYNNNQGTFETSSMTTSAMDASAFSPEVISDLSGPAQYHYNNGFNDIALLAEFLPSSVQAPEIVTQDSVEEFIASSDRVDYNEDGNPILVAVDSSDSAEVMDVAAMDDGE